MIPVTNPALFQTSLTQLGAYKKSIGTGFKGRFIQVFLGLKFYQNQIPSIYSGHFITSQVLQTLLDDLYAKASKPLNDSVLMLFEGSYLARTAIKGKGRKSGQNTWRNNLNIQKGIGCYAPANVLSSPAFLSQPRDQCQYLVRAKPNKFTGAHCKLCATGNYRNEQYRKWLHMDPVGHGYAAIDSSNTSNFVDYVAPQGQRIPILPLIMALYHDADMGLILSQRPVVDIQDFESDFNLSYGEFTTYFDDSSKNPYNHAVLTAGGNFTYTRAASGIASIAAPKKSKATKGGVPLPLPIPAGTVVPPPQQNSGWGAQQCVSAALLSAGWTVHDVSRQQLGCDLMAQKKRRTIFVEVKSSLSTCSPTLTNREWQQAQAHGANYVLAIVENFNEKTANTVLWIPNPAASCVPNSVQTWSHGIARSTWTAAVTPLTAI